LGRKIEVKTGMSRITGISEKKKKKKQKKKKK